MFLVETQMGQVKGCWQEFSSRRAALLYFVGWRAEAIKLFELSRGRCAMAVRLICGGMVRRQFVPG